MAREQALRETLERGAIALGIELSSGQIGQLLQYLELFARWNRAYNLSAVRDIEQMVGRHLLDSLAILPHIRGSRLIDVGTGGGLPGVVLAICRPDWHFTLLDSNGKKTRFLFHVKTQLKLDNVAVENTRVEAHNPDEGYHGVISRAFASLADMTHGCQHLLADGGRFYAMKGQFPEGELAAIDNRYPLLDRVALNVPGETGERHLLILGRS